MARSDVQDIVDGDRTEKYGHPFDSFTKIAAHWSTILGVEVTPEDVGHCMIAFKLVRDSYYPSQENRDDIEGYSYCLQKIAERRQIAKAATELNAWLDNPPEHVTLVGLDDQAEKAGPEAAAPTQPEESTPEEFIEGLLSFLMYAASVVNPLESSDMIQSTRVESPILGVWLDFEPEDDDSTFDDHYSISYEFEEDEPELEVDGFVVIYDFDREVM